MDEPEFNDPRLVAVYDAECRWSREDDFFAGQVGRQAGSFVVDLGCGTGRLALGLAKAGHHVTGVDPARASLDAARGKPGATAVTWIEGTSEVLPTDAFDVAVMTSHVAQFLVDEQEWRRTLADLRRTLRPGGLLLFDARDPQDRRWEQWNKTESLRSVALPDGTAVEVWADGSAVVDDVVSFSLNYHFADGSQARSPIALHFRSEHQLRTSLADAGFTVEAIFGGWAHEPVGHGDGELIVIARTSPSRRNVHN